MAANRRAFAALEVFGRLKPGVSLADAQLDMLAARAGIDDLIPQWKKDWSVIVEPGRPVEIVEMRSVTVPGNSSWIDTGVRGVPSASACG